MSEGTPSVGAYDSNSSDSIPRAPRELGDQMIRTAGVTPECFLEEVALALSESRQTLKAGF